MRGPGIDNDERYGEFRVSYENPKDAARVTGGQVHSVKGIERAPCKKGVKERNAFILTNQDGKKLLYVRVSYSEYKALVHDAAGENIAQTKGYDVDHGSAKTINKSKLNKDKDRYVVMTQLPKSVNRSYGREEARQSIRYPFHVETQGRLANGNLAVPAMSREVQKMHGNKNGERTIVDQKYLLADEKIATACLQDQGFQENLEVMKFELLYGGKDLPAPTYKSQKIDPTFLKNRDSVSISKSSTNEAKADTFSLGKEKNEIKTTPEANTCWGEHSERKSSAVRSEVSLNRPVSERRLKQ